MVLIFSKFPAHAVKFMLFQIRFLQKLIEIAPLRILNVIWNLFYGQKIIQMKVTIFLILYINMKK